MSKEILIAISFLFLLIKDAESCEPVKLEGNNHSFSHRNGLNYLPPLNGVSPNKVKPTENFIESLVKKYKTNDPYQLDEYSAHLFLEGENSEAATLLIAAGIYGHNETQDFLNNLDSEALKYITSSEAGSAVAINYYQSILLPKILKEFDSQAKQLEEAADKVTMLPGTEERTEIKVTFGNLPVSQ